MVGRGVTLPYRPPALAVMLEFQRRKVRGEGARAHWMSRYGYSRGPASEWDVPR